MTDNSTARDDGGMGGWRPIETAPETDGDIGAYGETFLVWDGCYVSPAKRDGHGNFVDLESVDRDGDWNPIYNPTHWMPLPLPPAPEPTP